MNPSVFPGSGSVTLTFNGDRNFGLVPITGPLTITADMTGAVADTALKITFLPNGVDVPTLVGFARHSSDATFNNAGSGTSGVPQILTLFPGDDGLAYYSHSQNESGVQVSVPRVPGFSAAPTLTQPVVGTPLSSTPGTAVGYPAPTVSPVIYYRNGTFVGSQYTPKAADLGATFTAVQTASLPGRVPVIVSSAGIAAIASGGGSAGTVQLSASTYSIGEGGGTITITATRTGGSAGAASVGYATSNGTATAGSDYSSTSGTLNWADGDAANKTFTVAIADDASVESAETFNVTLSSATGATLGSPSSAVVTINDNDSGGGITGTVTHVVNNSGQAETGTGPFIVAGTGGPTSYGQGGTAEAFAANAAGLFRCLGNASTGELGVLGLSPIGSGTSYNSSNNYYAIFGPAGGNYTVIAFGSGDTADLSVPVAATDIVQMRVDASHNVYAEVSKNNGSSYQAVKTWPSAFTTETLHANVCCTSTGVVRDLRNVGAA